MLSSSSWRDGGTARLSCENLSQRALVETIDDLRAESGADELFADEACTQPCTAADLVHGAIVYARHNAPEKEEGDAMADEEGG